MTLVYQAGQSRQRACWLWLLFCYWVCWFWFGVLGAGLVCIAATRWLRECRRRGEIVLELPADQLVQVWALPQVLRVQLTQGHCWVWRDELPLSEWRRLRRYLRINLPGQALGLSISR